MSLDDSVKAKISTNASYYAGPATMLGNYGGLIFRNTPLIQVNHQATYDDLDMTHTNYPMLAYKNSKISEITVTGKFTANTTEEARYTLAAIHLLRSVTKMHFGAGDEAAGTPPVVCYFSAMGEEIFNSVPVVVSNVNFNFDDASDYIEVSRRVRTTTSSSSTVSARTSAIPALTTITVTMIPYYSPKKQASKFTLGAFKSGSLLKRGWI